MISLYFIDKDISLKRFVIGNFDGDDSVLRDTYLEVRDDAELAPDTLIVAQDKATGVFYSNTAARDLLVLSHLITELIRPVKYENYVVYIQPTNSNEILSAGSSVLYWSGL